MLHLQILRLQGPGLVPALVVDSKYVQFSLTVAPHPKLTAIEKLGCERPAENIKRAALGASDMKLAKFDNTTLAKAKQNEGKLRIRKNT